MAIQLSAIRALDAERLTAWIEYEHVPGLELLIEFATTEETEELYGTDAGGKARDVPDDEFRDWHLARVLGWRGVLDGTSPAPLDREVLAVLWRKDARFRAWLVGRCRDIAMFLGGEDAAAALEVGTGSERGAA